MMFRQTLLNRYPLFLLASSIVAFVPASAMESEDEEAMRQIAECAFVVSQVEEEGVALSYGSATWNDIVSQVSQGTGLDARPYLELAQAKYRRMQRKMGADYAFNRLKQRAKQCNDQL